jgi:hypothetical protein
MMTVFATFHPQAWVNDDLVDVEPQGETSFDVTPEVESMGQENALAIKDNSNTSDVLQYSAHAPHWIKHWQGPFQIRVSKSIQEHYGQQKLCA